MQSPVLNGSPRRHMPHRRKNFTHEVTINGTKVELTCGMYEDGTLGEIFIDCDKFGSALRDWIGGYATLFSTSLQYGVPLEVLVKSFAHSRSDPCGPVTGHPTITHCTSILDFIAQVLREEFLQ